MPTLVEQWLERGRQEGLEKGREEGREAALVMLRRFLVRRFGPLSESLDQALSKLDLAGLTDLSDTAFEAESLAEIEAALAKQKPGDHQSSGTNGN